MSQPATEQNGNKVGPDMSGSQILLRVSLSLPVHRQTFLTGSLASAKISCGPKRKTQEN